MAADQDRMGAHGGYCTYRGRPVERSNLEEPVRRASLSASIAPVTAALRARLPKPPRESTYDRWQREIQLAYSLAEAHDYYSAKSMGFLEREMEMFKQLMATRNLSMQEQTWERACRFELTQAKRRKGRAHSQAMPPARSNTYVNPWSSRNAPPPKYVRSIVGGGLPTLSRRGH